MEWESISEKDKLLSFCFRRAKEMDWKHGRCALKVSGGYRCSITNACAKLLMFGGITALAMLRLRIES